MLNNILNLENVKKIDKKQQKGIAGGGLFITSYCGQCCQYCKSLGHDTGALHNGECYCSNYRH